MEKMRFVFFLDVKQMDCFSDVQWVREWQDEKIGCEYGGVQVQILL